jgi:ligand-binding sensor domain-containing protein/serine phosphatase RsbU (regulator of sigma subunit)
MGATGRRSCAGELTDIAVCGSESDTLGGPGWHSERIGGSVTGLSKMRRLKTMDATGGIKNSILAKGVSGLLPGLCALLFAALLFFVPCLHGQYSNLTFEEISIEEGLSQSIVHDIVQDSKGFLWFATEDGLNMYDGYTFKVFRHDPQISNSLSYNEVRTIYEDSSGVLWIGCFYGGLNRYDPRTERFTHYQNDPADPNSISHNNVKAILEDTDGALWIGTDGGLNRFDRKTEKFVRYRHDPTDPASLSNDGIRALFEDHSGFLWIATADGLNRFDRKTGEFTVYRHDPEDPCSLSDDRVNVIHGDQAGFLWIGTCCGLNKFERASNRFSRYRNDPNDPGSLSHDDIYAIYEDKKGILWIGTNGGGLNLLDTRNNTGEKLSFIRYMNDPRDPSSLSHNEVYAIYEDQSGTFWIGTYGGGTNKVKKSRKQFIHYKPIHNDPNSLPNEIVWSIYEDPSGVLWIGTHGGGLTRFDRAANRYKHFQNDPDDPGSLSHDIVRIVYADPQDSNMLWLGTNGGGLNRFDIRTENFTRFIHDSGNPNSLSHNELRCIYKDRSGVLWIGTNGGGLNRLAPDDLKGQEAHFTHFRNNPGDPRSLSNDYVRTVYEDPDEAGRFLWVGTQGGGLNKMDRHTGMFSRYRADPASPDSLNNDYILSLREDKAGIFWLGTWGGGVNRFDREKETFIHFTVSDGLAQNEVYGILEDNTGIFWISTNNGLSKFDPETGHFKNYSVYDGLQSNEFNGGSYFKSNSGELFFGGIRGLNAFYPENIKDNLYIPPIVITSFLKSNEEVILDRPVYEIEKLVLSYKDDVFSFEFAALDYTNPLKNRYAHKMVGLDEDWVYTDAKKRYATYTTLAPGKYVFKVKGSNNDGVWNEEGASIEIIITPPIWTTTWFRILSAMVVLGLAFLLYRRRLKTVQMRTELQAAHNAQMSIMPQADPGIDGFDISGICIPANEVGGDFFDYIWINEEKTKFLLVIGDVSGKAMTAAMTAVMASGIINAEVDKTNSVQEIMNSINGPLHRKTEKQMFVTLCLALLDTEKKEFVFSNAGLIEPVHKSGDSLTYLSATGSRHPIGMLKENIYQEKKVALNSGDVLVLLTDGIVEAQNRTKELYGDARLLNLIREMDSSSFSAREIKERIIQDVRAFSGKALQYDDMAVVVVKVL